MNECVISIRHIDIWLNCAMVWLIRLPQVQLDLLASFSLLPCFLASLYQETRSIGFKKTFFFHLQDWGQETRYLGLLEVQVMRMANSKM